MNTESEFLYKKRKKKKGKMAHALSFSWTLSQCLLDVCAKENTMPWQHTSAISKFSCASHVTDD